MRVTFLKAAPKKRDLSQKTSQQTERCKKIFRKNRWNRNICWLPIPLNLFLLGGETAVTVGPCACDRAMTDKSEEAPAPSTSAVSLEKSEEGEVPSALARKRQERKEEPRKKKHGIQIPEAS